MEKKSVDVWRSRSHYSLQCCMLSNCLPVTTQSATALNDPSQVCSSMMSLTRLESWTGSGLSVRAASDPSAALCCSSGAPAAIWASSWAMRWLSFCRRTWPSWASSSQCSFSCSRREIFSWLWTTCDHTHRQRQSGETHAQNGRAQVPAAWVPLDSQWSSSECVGSPKLLCTALTLVWPETHKKPQEAVTENRTILSNPSVTAEASRDQDQLLLDSFLRSSPLLHWTAAISHVITIINNIFNLINE